MSCRSDPIVQEIVSLHKSGDYQGILEQLRQVIASQDKVQLSLLHLLSWPIPTESDLTSLSEFLYAQKVGHVYSIGCGTGLLEWLLSNYLDKTFKSESENYDHRVTVTGVEVDWKWWNSQYAPPKFLPLQFVGKDFAAENPFGNVDDAAIFCYFNSIPVFLNYLQAFLGSFVVVIGPLSDKQFCAPDPLDLSKNLHLPVSNWQLMSCGPFGLVDIDHIAIYKRIDNPPEVKIKTRNGMKGA